MLRRVRPILTLYISAITNRCLFHSRERTRPVEQDEYPNDYRSLFEQPASFD